jgi:hypothetical protein
MQAVQMMHVYARHVSLSRDMHCDNVCRIRIVNHVPTKAR